MDTRAPDEIGKSLAYRVHFHNRMTRRGAGSIVFWGDTLAEAVALAEEALGEHEVIDTVNLTHPEIFE